MKQGTAPDAPTAWRNQFAYDPVGNRMEQIRQSENGTPQPVVYNYDERDRLLTENGISGPVTYGWDANGNQTAKSGTDGATYTWDIENRLVRVELVGGTIVEHFYDADGTRVRTRTAPSVGSPATVDYLIDPWHQTSVRGGLIVSQVVAETDATSTFTAYHLRGDDLLATLRPEAGNPTNMVTKYFHIESIGTIRALTDESGADTDRYTLESFGMVTSHQGTDPNVYIFAGEALEPQSGFSYLRARWVDPSQGRFLSVDTYGYGSSDPQSSHRYTYVRGHPADGVDPTGLFEGLSVALVSLAVSNFAALTPQGSAGPRVGPGKSRDLTGGEVALARSVFVSAIDYSKVKIHRKKWWPFHPETRAMTPRGEIYFHPNDPSYRDDFSLESFYLKALLIHELTHVWQHQSGTPVALRGAFERNYSYEIPATGGRFGDYGIEQQASIVEDYFLLRSGWQATSTTEPQPLSVYVALIPFVQKDRCRNASSSSVPSCRAGRGLFRGVF